MIKTTVAVEGMMCSMCESHIADAIRSAFPEAKKVSASKAKRSAEFLTDEAVDEQKLQQTIEATGYEFHGITTEPYEKKGFSLFRKK